MKPQSLLDPRAQKRRRVDGRDKREILQINVDGLERVVLDDGENPLGEHYECFKVSNNTPAEIKSIAKKYAIYLKRDLELCHIPFRDDAAEREEYDYYLVVNTERTNCLGIFIFIKPRYKSLEEGLEARFSEKLNQKQVLESEAKDFFSDKFFECRKKLNNAKSALRKAEKNSDDEDIAKLDCEKYGPKVSNYDRLRAFATIKSNFPTYYTLNVAWMHEPHRQQGILSRLWPVFRNEYRDIFVSSPSDAMQKFINHRHPNEVEYKPGGLLIPESFAHDFSMRQGS